MIRSSIIITPNNCSFNQQITVNFTHESDKLCIIDFISSNTDATQFWFTLTNEDWKELKKQIDKQLD